MTARLSRRALLQALGLGGAALCAPGLRRRARAGGDGAPRRLVVFYTMHGTVYDAWRMRRTGLAEDADWEIGLDDPDPLSMSEILRPLHPVRDRLLVLDGLAQVSAVGDIGFNEHSKGQAHSLTGSAIMLSGADDAVATGPSIDQVIAAAVRRPDLLASLELGAGWGSYPSVIYGGPGLRLPAERNPQAVFERLFPGTAETGEVTDEDRVRAGQSSVLDLVQGEHDALAPRLPAADRAKLELHRDLVRDLERRLGALAEVSCDRPGQPGPLGFDAVEQYERGAAAMFQLTAAALACDLTRVVTLQMGQLHNPMIGSPAGDVHADFAHHDDEATGRAMMTAYHRVHAEQLAQLVELLASVPEGSGSLLDNTAVVWCGELATGRHSFLRWPVVIAGGCGGAFRSGRYLHWAARTPTPFPHPDWMGVEPIIGPPHNRLLVSLCRAFGLDVDSFGETEVVTAGGDSVSLTGPLDRLS
jgi:hypothetical protein